MQYSVRMEGVLGHIINNYCTLAMYSVHSLSRKYSYYFGLSCPGSGVGVGVGGWVGGWECVFVCGVCVCVCVWECGCARGLNNRTIILYACMGVQLRVQPGTKLCTKFDIISPTCWPLSMAFLSWGTSLHTTLQRLLLWLHEI